MYRSYPNVSPVANKYIGHKILLKAQADHEYHIKTARSVLNRTQSMPRTQCPIQVRQQQIREKELATIKQENERMRKRMRKTESFLDNHNHYVLHSLNIAKRQREQSQHNSEFQRLQKQLNHVRPTYPARGFRDDYAKVQNCIRRLSRFPPSDK